MRLLWEPGLSDDEPDPFMPVAVSIGDMLRGLTSVDGFPCDCWAARDYGNLFNADAPP